MSQRVLVLGGNGFIGRRVVARLSADPGFSAIAAGRRQPAFRTEGIDAQILDATDELPLRRAMADVTSVVNCVAADPDTIVRSARALFSAAAQISPSPRIVHLSSLAAYGSVCGAVDETVVARGDLGPYSAAKLETERLAVECATAVTLRPGIVYGPGSPWWSDRIARLLRTGRIGDLGEAGMGLCNVVHVEDVAAAVLQVLRLPAIESQIFNLGLPSVPTWNDYFVRYAAALKIPARRISATRLAAEQYLFAAPLKLLELSGHLGLAHRATLPPPIRPWLLTLCRHRIGMVASRAEKVLGMRWTPLDQGLQDTADWFLAGGRT